MKKSDYILTLQTWLGALLETKSVSAIMVLHLPSMLSPATPEHLKMCNSSHTGSLYLHDACQRKGIKIPG